jgi:hypothetical protein
MMVFHRQRIETSIPVAHVLRFFVLAGQFQLLRQTLDHGAVERIQVVRLPQTIQNTFRGIVVARLQQVRLTVHTPSRSRS